MKFSVLLPTRNRLEYLKYAVLSVLKQGYDNWEIIISDNHSEENIADYVASLKDPRIKYFRTNAFLPVTDNWNNALKHSTGDYIIMLGDDDCLLSDFFKNSLNYITKFDKPDLIYSSALLYAYPHVFPDHPEGYTNIWGNACFLEGRKEPFIIDKQEAIRLVKETLNFKVMFNFNMQFSLVSRKIVDKLKKQGEFYQSPYPDYYATTVLMLTADKILAVPRPLVAVGITKKSFGYYFFNEKEEDGVAFLQNIPEQKTVAQVSQYIMPGTDMNTSWLLAMETVKQNFGEAYQLKVNYRKYRFLQTLHYFKRFALRQIGYKSLLNLNKYLNLEEKITFCLPLYLETKWIRMQRREDKRFIRSHMLGTRYSHPPYAMKEVVEKFPNILALFDREDILK